MFTKATSVLKEFLDIHYFSEACNDVWCSTIVSMIKNARILGEIAGIPWFVYNPQLREDLLKQCRIDVATRLL